MLTISPLLAWSKHHPNKPHTCWTSWTYYKSKSKQFGHIPIHMNSQCPPFHPTLNPWSEKQSKLTGQVWANNLPLPIVLEKRQYLCGSVTAQHDLNRSNKTGVKKQNWRQRPILFFVSSLCVNYQSDAGAQTEVALELMNYFKTVLLNDESNLD